MANEIEILKNAPIRPMNSIKDHKEDDKKELRITILLKNSVIAFSFSLLNYTHYYSIRYTINIHKKMYC